MGPVERGASIDELLDRAVAAINRGDRVSASALAGQVLAVDPGNAEDLLAAPGEGEIRRLTILFADLVDSTVLSTRVEPETYRMVVGRYRDLVLRVLDRYEGHVGSTKGDGLLAVFGHPTAHEDDAGRAVLAGLEITREVARLGEEAKRRVGGGGRQAGRGFGCGGVGVARVAVSHRRRPAPGAHLAGAPLRHHSRHRGW